MRKPGKLIQHPLYCLISNKFHDLHIVPDYDDTFPLPAAGQSAVWKYKALYLLSDERVGQWSDEVSVTGMG